MLSLLSLELSASVTARGGKTGVTCSNSRSQALCHDPTFQHGQPDRNGGGPSRGQIWDPSVNNRGLLGLECGDQQEASALRLAQSKAQ